MKTHKWFLTAFWNRSDFYNPVEDQKTQSIPPLGLLSFSPFSAPWDTAWPSLCLHRLLTWPPSYPHLNIAQSFLLHVEISLKYMPISRHHLLSFLFLKTQFLERVVWTLDFPPSPSTPIDSLTHWNFTSLSLSLLKPLSHRDPWHSAPILLDLSSHAAEDLKDNVE